jgi:hypothetical protein
MRTGESCTIIVKCSVNIRIFNQICTPLNFLNQQNSNTNNLNLNVEGYQFLEHAIFQGSTVKTSTSFIAGLLTEYLNVQPWQAPACSPVLLRATTAPTKSGNYFVIRAIASLAASLGSIPNLMLSTT